TGWVYRSVAGPEDVSVVRHTAPPPSRPNVGSTGPRRSDPIVWWRSVGYLGLQVRACSAITAPVCPTHLTAAEPPARGTSLPVVPHRFSTRVLCSDEAHHDPRGDERCAERYEELADHAQREFEPDPELLPLRD